VVNSTEEIKEIINSMIRTDSFCVVVTDTLKQFGVERGSYVFIAGTQAIPEDKNDPYTQRVKFIVCPCDGQHIISDRMILIDPTSIQKVTDVEDVALRSVMEEDFAQEPEPECPVGEEEDINGVVQ
jgi:hypothetical protein